MAHALRYYKDLVQPNGTIIRLEIHRKKDGDAPWVAKEIGRVVQALHLDIQGGADTIDAPIVKTSLTMTFVDAPDLEPNKKCGDWEEFYTPDSTMWKVVLKADDKIIWSGYVTPDSYQEDLRYRGSVTIIARDNIGHMQDFPFDMEGNADGMVTLQELVNEAWAKIESPMKLDWRHEADDADYLLCDGVEAPQTYMNVSAFEDMNYFDAVEKALYSYGLVMRFVGSNRVAIMSLRDLPYQGKSDAPRPVEPTFLAHAQRELAPAVRRIEESVKYEDVEAVQPQVKPSDFSGVSDSYAYEFGHPNGATLETAPVHNIINTDERNGWANMPGKTLFFNAGLYKLSNFDKIQPYADIMHRYMYIAVNNVQNISLDNVERFVSYGRNMLYQDFGFSLNLGILIEWSGALVLSKVTGYTLSGITYAVGCEYEGDIIYYAGDGKWQDSVCEITQEIPGNEENNTIDIPVLVDRTKSYKTATFILYIRRISYTRQGDLASGRGLYAAVQSLSITHNNALLSDNTVNTVYNNDNNVIISREPEIAPALNSVILPSVIKNGIFVKSGNAYLPAKGWAWRGGTPQQMAVYNHLQMLCYHSKPNNVISGDIVHFDALDMKAIYEWGGANHLLVSGSYNFLNGRIESAVLREFKFYYEMWGDIPDSQLPPSEQTNRTTAEGGYSTSNNATYEETTNVSIYAGGGGSTIIVDTKMSDTSTNPVQNKVVKKYIDDEVVYLEGYAENMANNAEANAKAYSDEKVRELYLADESSGETLTEEQKAYNAETYRMFAEGLTPIVAREGCVGCGIWYEDEELGAVVDFIFKVDFGDYQAIAEAYLMEDGSIELVGVIYAQKILYLDEPYCAQIFFENWGFVAEHKGIIRSENTFSEVDAVGYNGRHYVEYNLHDKRYRVEFNADYTINKTIDITPAGGEGGGSEIIKVKGLTYGEIFPITFLEMYFPENEYVQRFANEYKLTREMVSALLPLMDEAYGEETSALLASIYDSIFSTNQAAYLKFTEKAAQGEAASVIVDYGSAYDGGVISSAGSVISDEASGSFEVTSTDDGIIQKIVPLPRMTIFSNGDIQLDPPNNEVYFATTGQLAPVELRQNIYNISYNVKSTSYMIASDRNYYYTSLWVSNDNRTSGFIDENGISRVLTINADGTSYITPPFATSETE